MSRIPKQCKRLAEVDFPIAVVSKHSAKEKSIRHGHPSTLHLWWARRPLAACRAMLMALLLPDPVDPHCPPEFIVEARKILLAHPGASKRLKTEVAEAGGLRKALLKFIGDFANWDLASNPDYLRTSRALVKAAHGDEAPLVVDPFAGGGSIPLEALRIGCDAFASDLNPVACLILKTMLEDIPRHGPGLADDLRKVGAEIKKEAERELKSFYPDDADGSTPIAYLWARTVRCEAPDCGADVPLMRSFWLSKKPVRRRALRPIVRKGDRRKGGASDPPTIAFEVFTPKSEKEVRGGTVARAKATCLACGNVLAPERVRSQLFAQRGGADVVFDSKGRRTGGATLLAVVSLHENKTGRQYRVAEDRDYRTVWKAQKRVAEIAEEPLPNGLSPIPWEPTPAGGGSGAGRAFSVQKYGMLKFGDIFTARQKVALGLLERLVQGVDQSAVAVLLAFLVGRSATRSTSLCLWLSHADQETVWTTFGRQTLPIVWDFAEAVLTSESTGSLSDGVEVIAGAVRGIVAAGSGSVQQADARSPGLPDDSASVIFTDPPYYDAVPYSDLSDFFLVLLRRGFREMAAPDPFDATNTLSPKDQEMVQDETRSWLGQPKGREFFESAMAQAFVAARKALRADGIASVVFAHKTTEGWEALLSGIVRGGFIITGSWPIATERRARPRAHGSAALETSIHLVLRPRPDDAPVGEWADVARELPQRIGDWMQRLSREGVRGADLVFACIGPAMEVYSRYSKVEDAEGREIPLGGNPEASRPHERGFLAYVWEFVGRAALNQVLGTGQPRPTDTAAAGLEEDARLTALFLWTLQATATDDADDSARAADLSAKARSATVDDTDDADSDADEGGEAGAASTKKKKGLTLVYDVVRRFAQPLGIHLAQWEHRIVEIEKGVVRLLPVSDRAEQLFGDKGADVVAGNIESAAKKSAQGAFDFIFDQPDAAPALKGRAKPRSKGAMIRDEDLATRQSATTLDRVHAAMLLQSAGRATALRAFLQSEVDRGPVFLRLANALSALYPRESEEKRLLDAMLLAIPR